MIEVIKHGKEKFIATCRNCGCEFTYELSDIIGGYVICPDCSRSISHNFISSWGSTTPATVSNVTDVRVTPTTINNLRCELR